MDKLLHGDKILLGIETSCDETSAAIVKNGREILSNIISSQINLHKKYGGVVPELASRKHVESICAVVEEALSEAKTGFEAIDGICVTYGPGLAGALLVGLSYAKALSYTLKKPLIGVQHIEGHICSNYLGNNFNPPFICLVVSGGHTHLAIVNDYGQYTILGRTLDDAAGEAFDKIARALGLSYPGGPEIDKLAKKGDPYSIAFPRAIISDNSYDFSFSGLKSAVINYIHKCRLHEAAVSVENIAASFQQAVIDVLVDKTIKACDEYKICKVALAGGVSANSELRNAIRSACNKKGYELNMPAPIYCTDNAAMIASCGYYEMISGKRFGLDLNAYPNLGLGEHYISI